MEAVITTESSYFHKGKWYFRGAKVTGEVASKAVKDGCAQKLLPAKKEGEVND